MGSSTAPALVGLDRLRRWLGPLGRYRPSFFRQDLARGFHNCDPWALPAWVRWRAWSSPEERLLERLDLAGKVVYDVGAFTGAYSLYFSRRVGTSGQVVAFEPQSQSFARLTRNLRDNCITNVLPLRVALGAESGARPIYLLAHMYSTASLADAARTPLRRCAGVTCVEPLDSLLGTLALPPPDFVKIDVEGLELDVLAGARATLQRLQPRLLVEVHGAGRRFKTAQIRHIAALLLPLGYLLTHTESGRILGPDVSDIAAGHIFAEPVIRTTTAVPAAMPAVPPAR